MKNGTDRQVVSKLSKIHPGHFARYKFAMSRVSGYVLDAACGVGYGSYMLSNVAECVGVDIERQAIEYAIQYYPGPEYRIADVTEPQGAFDWVVSFETIEHLKEPEKALRAFRESDKLIISTPNEELYPFRQEQHNESKYPHIRHYTPDQFEELLTGCGWKVKERHGQVTKLSDVSRGTGKFLVWVCE